MPTLHYELLGLVGAEHSPEAAQAILTQVRDEVAKAGARCSPPTSLANANSPTR